MLFTKHAGHWKRPTYDNVIFRAYNTINDVNAALRNGTLDVAYGGMWYAIVDAASVGLRLEPSQGREICRLGEMIKVAAREQHTVHHPELTYPGPDILVFREPATQLPGGELHARNAVVMSNNVLDWARPETWTGMIDRSPCGTGTCAVMAALHARGELALGQPLHHESIIGTTFVGELLEHATVGELSLIHI